MKCMKCGTGRVLIKRSRNGDKVCKECFFLLFETDVHKVITEFNLFKRGEVVAIGVSGGKDSTVLAHILDTLNRRYDYGLDLRLLSIDEGITGYRDDSLETVKRNETEYGLPLTILSYQDLYGWTMDSIVKQIGKKNNCTFCGVFRRQALDRGAKFIKANKVVTGHNADDVAETVIMNIMRGDVARLKRCTSIVTGDDPTGIPRVKPLKYAYEKEIVSYAHHKKLDYFSTECIYSPEAYRGNVRNYIKNLEAIRPRAIMDIIHSGENMIIEKGVKLPKLMNCVRCDYISSNDVCKACVLLEGLNKGMAKVGIGKTSKIKKSLINHEELKKKYESQKNLDEKIKERRNNIGCNNSNKVCCGSGHCRS